MDKIDPTLMSYLKGPYGAASLPSLNDVNKMQLALPGYGKQSKSHHIKRFKMRINMNITILMIF